MNMTNMTTKSAQLANNTITVTTAVTYQIVTLYKKNVEKFMTLCIKKK